MKKFISIFLILVFGLSLVSCAIPIHSIGFINSDGEWVQDPIYYGSLPYSDQLFAVNVGGSTYGKWGFVDINGEVVIDYLYDEVLSFYNGYAPVMQKSGEHANRWFFIDKTGKPAFKDKYFLDASVFSEGLAAVESASSDTYEKWGYIDISGNYVIEPSYGVAGIFSDGLAKVRVGLGNSGLCGFINKDNELVIEPLYAYCGYFSEGLAPVKRTFDTDKSDWGYIDKSGNLVLDFKYGYAKAFREGLAPVIEGDPHLDKFSYIDKEGNTILSAQYYRANPFYEGKAAIKRYPYDNTGWGFIDLEGNLIIGGDFASCSDFKDGYATAGIIIRRK